MSLIVLDDVVIDFPIYAPRDRSLRAGITGRIGGRIEASKRYQRTERTVMVRALDHINMQLAPGDRLGLIGPNGAGKSTLLRAMAGVYEPTSGELTVQGRISSLLDISLGMDYELTGYENIRLRGVFMGMRAREIDAKIDDIASFSDLGDFLNLPVRTYSSGMMMRLAFAISTSNHPDVVILDEMIGVGDAEFRARAQTRINGVIEGAQILVVASHDQKMLRSYCTKGAWIEGGRLMAFGMLDDVLARYAERAGGSGRS